MAASPPGDRGTAKALLDEMKRRLERGACAALGIEEGATAQIARSAFLQLTKVYHPAKFARETAEIVREANEVFFALRAAYETVVPSVKKPSRGGTMPGRLAPGATTGAGSAASASSSGFPRDGTMPGRPASEPGLARDRAMQRGSGAGAHRPNDETPGRVPGPRSPTPPMGTPTSRSGGPKSPTPPMGRPTVRLPTPPMGTPTLRSRTPPMGTPTARTPGAAQPLGTSQRLKTPAPPGTQPGFGASPKSGSVAQGAATPVAKPASGTEPGFPDGGKAAATQRLGTRQATTKLGTVSSMAPLDADATGQASEDADLEAAMVYLRRRQWSEARKTLHGLAARVPAEKRYRALLSYARGREAQDDGRHDEARTEFTRALALDPELQIAKAALVQVTPKEPAADRPSGGLFSKLFKK